MEWKMLTIYGFHKILGRWDTYKGLQMEMGPPLESEDPLWKLAGQNDLGCVPGAFLGPYPIVPGCASRSEQLLYLRDKPS